MLSCFGFAQNQAPKSTDWWDQQVWSRITYSGSRTIGYQNFRFQGDQDAFSSLTNYGTGLQHFTDIGSLSLQGSKVFGILDFRASFADNRFSDPEQQQYTLNYKRGLWDVSYGTVQASLLNTNRFANFSRSLDGLVADYKTGRLEAKAISSEARGAARTVNIPGNNTAGPYYLQSGRIIGGSIRVLLDGVELQQGADYIVDVAVGSVTFVNRIIAPTSSIVASYESYDPTSSGGSIRGAAMAYNLGNAGRIGVNVIQQLAGSNQSTNDRIESFQGFGPPGSPYPLTYEPDITKPIIVTVDGIQRTFSVVDDHVSEFFFGSVDTLVISRITVPSTQTLQIRYTPKVIAAVAGDRKVTGFDWTLPLGTPKDGSFLTYSKTRGEMSGPSGSSGNAESLDIKMNEGKGSLKIDFRKVDPGFVSIEQTGFNRNEDAAEYSYDYYTKGFNTGLSTSNSLISVNDGTTITNNRLISTNFNLRYSDPTRTPGQATRTQSFTASQSRFMAADDNNLTTYSFKDDFHNKKFTFGYGIDDQIGHGRVNGNLTVLGVNSYRTSVSYDAGKNWALSASASKSFVRTDTVSSAGYDYALRANMTQSGPWTTGLEYAISDSGLLSALTGFTNGNSVGYGNNGFSGAGGGSIVSTGALKTRRASINATHQAGEALTIGGTYSTTLAQGDSTSNSTINSLQLNSSWRINQATTLVLDFVNVKSDFIASTIGSSTSNSFSGFLVGSLGKKWSYSMGYSLLQTIGSQADQTNLGLNADLSYRLAPRQRLFSSASLGRTRGSFPQDDRNLQAGYAYSLTSGIELAARYSFRDLVNLDPAATTGAFRANGFSIELKFELANRH